MNKQAATTEEIAKMFDAAIATAEDAEVATKRQLLRNYFCTPGFAKKLADAAWENAQ